MPYADALTAVLAAVALVAGHHAGDRWLQTDHQAVTKGACTHAGRAACTGHVATLTLAQLAMLALVLAATGTGVSPLALLLGLGLNAASHWWADRRFTLRGLVLATDPIAHKSGYYGNGGAEPLDQAFHFVWIVPCALVIASPAPLALALTGAGVLLLAAAEAASRWARTREHTG
ncbi:hypothetical protein HNR25_005186 [Streptomonospora salina]|uniref:DUF3307 domain-containing protein n=1 Tax=Streptomonospora salina TaxID=104205 RepID=A0A841EDZ0_9ACTN|nr:hypothetical protein [Streptomonospora salina]MBB6001355.1 hypothetical protein [Streptomonospora salina]